MKRALEMKLQWIGDDYNKKIKKAIYILNGGKQLAENNKNALLVFADYFEFVQESFIDYVKIVLRTRRKPKMKITFY